MTKIVNITSGTRTNAEGQQVTTIYGLGDDNVMYYWDLSYNKWTMLSVN